MRKLRLHTCAGGEVVLVAPEDIWPAKDAQGIFLCYVCDRCEKERLAKYRPEVLSGYDQRDADEPIDPEVA